MWSPSGRCSDDGNSSCLEPTLAGLLAAAQHYHGRVPDILSHPQIAAFFAESLPSVGGQVIPPAGYFPKVAE